MASKSSGSPGTCPECGHAIGGETGTDPYKHLIQCMHLPNEGVERLMSKFQSQDDERARRVMAGLRLCRKEG